MQKPKTTTSSVSKCLQGFDNLGQTHDLMAATPEAGARAARTRAQWMSAVKRNALKREYEDEDPLDEEENEETLDEATSNCRRRTSLMREWASRVHLQRSLLQQMQPCENNRSTRRRGECKAGRIAHSFDMFVWRFAPAWACVPSECTCNQNIVGFTCASTCR